MGSNLVSGEAAVVSGCVLIFGINNEFSTTA